MAKKKKRKTKKSGNAGKKNAKKHPKKNTGKKKTRSSAKSSKKSGSNKKQQAPAKADKKSAKKPVKEPEKQPAKKQKKVSFIKKIKRFLYKYRKPFIAGVSVAGFLILWNLANFVITFALQGTALPGTRIAGIDVGSLTVDEIQNKLMDKGDPFLETPIAINLNEKEEKFLPSELGVSLLPRHTLEEVRFVSMTQTGLTDIFNGVVSGREIPFYVSVDIEKAKDNIETRFEFADKKAKNATLAFEEGELKVVPGRSGEIIDIRSLYKDIKNNANDLKRDPVTVKTVQQEPYVTAQDLEDKMEQIKEKLNSTITLYNDNDSWDLKLIDHIDWVDFSYRDNLDFGGVVSVPVNPGNKSIENLPENISYNKELWITVDEKMFYSYVDAEIAPYLEVEPEKVSIYTDENDEIVIEGKGEDGREIMRPHMLEAVTLAANYNIKDVPVPVQIEKVAVEVSDDLQMLGIETLIGTGRSAFAGSPPNRVHNIGVGVNRFNGTLVEPGEEFSFNKHLGPVNAATGYRPELVIKPEGTIPEYGGGLCQVSTTFYRAALFAGLPIIERSPHSYAVSYYAQVYGYGLDATIYIGARDVRFLNDTPGHILIQAYTEGTNAYFKFYGTDDGRSVELDGPYIWGWTSPGPAVVVESNSLAPGARRQVEVAHTGFKAMWHRYLTKDGETVKEDIFSHYRAIPARILVGPAAAKAEETGG
jgi:vancomycin resistance protein YoaR